MGRATESTCCLLSSWSELSAHFEGAQGGAQEEGKQSTPVRHTRVVCSVHQSPLLQRFKTQICSLICIPVVPSPIITKAYGSEGLILSRGLKAASSLKKHGKYLEHAAEPAVPLCHDEQPRPDPLHATLLLSTVAKPSGAFGSFESPQREFRCCGVPTFSFLACRGWTEEILQRFPFREKSPKPAIHKCVCSPAGVILQESSLSHPAFGMCFYLEDCEFLPCSGEHHFHGTDRNLNLSNAVYLTNESLDILLEKKCQFSKSPSPQGIVQNLVIPQTKEKLTEC